MNAATRNPGMDGHPLKPVTDIEGQVWSAALLTSGELSPVLRLIGFGQRALYRVDQVFEAHLNGRGFRFGGLNLGARFFTIDAAALAELVYECRARLQELQASGSIHGSYAIVWGRDHETAPF
jgi:hypothetical protein